MNCPYSLILIFYSYFLIEVLIEVMDPEMMDHPRVSSPVGRSGGLKFPIPDANGVPTEEVSGGCYRLDLNAPAASQVRIGRLK